MLKQKTEEPAFDVSVSHKNPINQEAARARGLKFDKKKRAYVDSEGSLVRDQFGQPY